MWAIIVHRGVVAYVNNSYDLEGYSQQTFEKSSTLSKCGYVLPTSNRSWAFKDFAKTGRIELSLEQFRICTLITHDDRVIIYNATPDSCTYFDLGTASEKVLHVHCGDIEYRNAIRTAIHMAEHLFVGLDTSSTDSVTDCLRFAIDTLSKEFPFNTKDMVFTTVSAIIDELKENDCTEPLIGFKTIAVETDEYGVSMGRYKIGNDKEVVGIKRQDVSN